MRFLTTIMLALCFAGGAAEADRWDRTGWVKLGEQSVNGRVDRDRINVGARDGKFTKLNLVVEDSDLELLEFEVVFTNGQKWNPRMKHYFRENARTRTIDLPGAERLIKHIDLKYKNIRGGGNARVEVWGFKTGDVGRRPAPSTWRWDPTGWQMLGQNTVNGRVDKDRINVGRYKGKFSKVAIVVLDSDLELIDFAVQFARGPEWRPSVKHYFKEGDRSRVIDFPGDDRQLRYIDLKYKNLPGGGRAKVQVWAR